MAMMQRRRGCRGVTLLVAVALGAASALMSIQARPGQRKTEVTEDAKGGAALAIVDAPIFYPTDEEFVDPMAYIRSIQARAYDYGIFRIQPP